MIGFRRLNHNSDFSFLHVKNPVGEFSPTGFVEQPIKHELCHYHLHQEGKGYRHQDRDFKLLLRKVEGIRFVERMEPYRYIYSCNSCGATFYRMRKIDTNKFRCGRCRGSLVLDSKDKP